MCEIKLRQQEIKAIFTSFQNPDEKWKYLMRLSKEHLGMDESLKAEKFIVQGCAARMFLVPKYKDGLLFFYMDTEGGAETPLISRGLGALALKIYNGISPQDILKTDPQFFKDIGLDVGLSPTRANGFASLLKQIYLYAQVFSAL